MEKESKNSPFLNDLANGMRANSALLNLPMDEFLDVVKEHLGSSQVKNKTCNLEQSTLLPGQAMYVMDYPHQKVSYQRNMHNLLGYSEDELTLDLLLNYFDPKQHEVLQRIIKCAINFGLTQNPNEEDSWMFLTFKARKKDGSFIPLLRQTSIYEKDENGKMISSFSILSDLTGMTNAEKVEWKLKGSNEDENLFRDLIYAAYSNFFTKRESLLLPELEKGLSSMQIANKLHISKNTVDTHRRNMLKKVNCTNTAELISFARKNGII